MVTTAQHCTLPLQTSVNASMDDLDNGNNVRFVLDRYWSIVFTSLPVLAIVSLKSLQDMK